LISSGSNDGWVDTVEWQKLINSHLVTRHPSRLLYFALQIQAAPKTIPFIPKVGDFVYFTLHHYTPIEMSVPSAHTLISPATTANTMQRSNSHHGHKARTASHHHHGHHAHAHGHAKRRPSAHAAHTTGHLGTGRRGSEGDGGRKAIFQGLTMAAMDGKGKKAEEVCFVLRDSI